MNADQLTGLFNNDPGGSVGYRKNPGAGFDPIVPDILNHLIDHVLSQNLEMKAKMSSDVINDSSMSPKWC
jgi:hypothetical protein